MRVAFCISGQFRDEALSFHATSRLAHELGAVVFISTWKKRGTKATGVILEAQADRMFGDEFKMVVPRSFFEIGISNVFPDFERAIAGTFSDVEPEDIYRYFPNATVDIESEIMPLAFEEKVNDNNSLKMLYKIWRCNELKRAYEKLHDKKFDLVVRFRPDIVPMLTLQQIEEMLAADMDRHLWAPYGESSDFVHDVLAVSSSRVSDYYAAIFGKALQSPTRPWRLVHHELAAHLAEAGIHVKNTPTAQWMKEDFAPRQKCNRSTLRKLIAARRYNKSILKDHDEWNSLLWILQDLETTIDGDAGEILNGDFLRQSNVTLLKSFPREVFFLTALVLEKAGDKTSSFLAKCLSLIIDLKNEGAHLVQSGDFRDVALSAFQVGLESGFHPPFDFESLKRALTSNEIHACLRLLYEDYLPLCTEHELREAAEMLATVADNVDFYFAAFDHALYGKHDLEAAEPIARHMVEKFPSDWRSFDRMSHFMGANRRLDEALDFARKALELDPHSGGLMTRIGYLASELNNLAMAEEYLSKATLVWDHDMPWKVLIDLFIRAERRSEARALVTRARERFPEHVFQEYESRLSAD